MNAPIARPTEAAYVAVERGDPMLAPVAIRREALELARMVTG